MKKYFLTLILSICMSDIFSQNVPHFTGSQLDSLNAQVILNHHNKARHDVGVPPLAWSTKLANYAQGWADYLSAHNHCKMKHSNCKDIEGNTLGENLWWGSSPTFYKPIDASIGWLSEREDYAYQRYSSHQHKPIGHYTQMIWKATKEIGVGIAYCPNGEMLVVASYYPAGNWIGEYPY